MSGVLLAAVGNSYGYKPINTVAPAVTGTAQARQTLTCSTGTWNAAPLPITYSYQWKKNGSNISGATNSTYVVLTADVGSTIKCTVTATNAVGATSADSNTTATVIANVPTAPTIGTATVTSATSASVTFTASTDNGGATITGYTVVSVPGGLTGTGGSSPITVSGLTPNTNYYFYAYATNSVGNSANSGNSNTITTPDAYFLSYGNTGMAAGGEVAANFIDGSNNIYTINQGGYVNRWFRFNSAGTISVQKDVSIGTYGYSGKHFLPTGNAVMFDRYAYAAAHINTSGTIDWQYKYTNSSNSYLPTVYVRRSDGEIWAIGNRTDQFLTPYIIKIQSNGTAIMAAALSQFSSNLQFNAGAFDGSNNFYAVGYTGNTGLKGWIYSYPSSGTYRYSYRFSDTGGSSSRTAALHDVKAYGSSVFIAGQTYNNTIVQSDIVMSINQSAPPSINWIRVFYGPGAGQNNRRRMAVDSSGNIYVACIRSNVAWVIKVNSSGTLQWQRTLTCPAAGVFQGDSIDLSLSNSGSFYVISSKYYDGSTTGSFMFKAPTDGSNTSNFSGPGGTWSYAASGYTFATHTAYNFSAEGGASDFVYSVTTTSNTSISTSNSSYTFTTYPI